VAISMSMSWQNVTKRRRVRQEQASHDPKDGAAPSAEGGWGAAFPSLVGIAAAEPGWRAKPGAGSCVAWACRAPERLCVDVHSAKGANGQSADEERGGVLAMERGARPLRSTDRGLGPEPPSRDGYGAPG